MVRLFNLYICLLLCHRSRSYLWFTPDCRICFLYWNEEHVNGEGQSPHVRLNVLPLTSCSDVAEYKGKTIIPDSMSCLLLHVVTSRNKTWRQNTNPAHPYTNSFVDCIRLEIYQTVYEQTSRFVCSCITTKHLEKTDSVSLLENPTLNPNSKIQLEILTRNPNSTS